MTPNTNQSDMVNDFLRLTVSQPVMGMISMQGEIMGRLGQMAETWGQNRRQDAEAARDAVRRLSDSRNAEDVSAIYSDWMRGAMERVSNDLSCMATHSQGILQAGLGSAYQMQQSGAAAVDKAGNQMARAAE